MSKISLTDLANLQNETTAVNAINANNAILETASDNTLSRDGTSPNTMSALLDMNSNQIINLPTPATANSPARLKDVQAGGTITNIPAGGTTGQVLAKSSNTDYQVAWTSESAELSAGTNIVLTGTTPTTIATTVTPTFTTVNTATIPTVADTLVGRATSDTLTNKIFDTASNDFRIAGTAVTASTGTGSIVRATSPTITTPTLSTPTLTTPVLGTPSSGTLTSCTGLPISTGVSGLGTNVSTFLATPSSANLIAAMTDETGTGANVFATSPTLVTPILGTPTSGTLTNCTGLPLSGHTNQAAYTIVANNTGGSAVPTAVDIPTITSKATPVSADIVLIQDSAASNAFKRTTVGAIGSVGAVSSFNTLTGAVTSNVVVQKFTASGTYTPTSGMLHCIIECVGGGGGSGGIVNGGAGTGGSPGGGGAGGYSRTYSTAAAIGASKTVTIGAAGAAGSGAGPTAGGARGDTSVGTLCIAKGGSGGAAGASGSGGLGGVLGTGDVTGTGDPGGTGMNQAIITVTTRGPKGGSSPWGGGGRESVSAGVAVPGENGSGYGSGAGAGATQNAAGAANGNSGTSGLVIITEFINL